MMMREESGKTRIAFYVGLFLVLLAVCTMSDCTQAAQKEIYQVSLMPNLPHPLEMREWKQVARDYDRLVFDFITVGRFLPLIEWDSSQPNVALDTFFLPSYVGDTTQRPGAQEAINTLAAVVGASLVGIDKSNQVGENWVLMQQQYFNHATGQGQILNNTQTCTGGSFWYEIFPAMLFFMLVDQYPETARTKIELSDGSGAVTMEDIMYATAENYLVVIESLKEAGGDKRRDFPWNSYRFASRNLVANQEWCEPDGLAGMAWMSYMAYQKFNEERFLEATLWTLSYLERLQGNPFYEVLLPYGASLAARVNAEQGSSFDVARLINWCFAPSSARPGWGVVAETWGIYDVHGLQGSLTDGGGYAFAMNTFQIAAALVPLVRYDSKYATDIGKWILNLANNARLFYPEYLSADHQSSHGWAKESRNLVTYEGLRKEWQGQIPYASGDALPCGLAETDYALYGASHVGFLGGMVNTTEQPGILQIDLLATDHFGAPSYPSYLLYNPYDERREVSIEAGKEPVAVYDLVSKEFLCSGVTGRAVLSIPAESAVAPVLVPIDGQREYRGCQMLVNGIVVDYQCNQFVITYPHSKERASGKVGIELDLTSSSDFVLQNFEILLGGRPLYRGETWPTEGIFLDTETFPDGDYELIVKLCNTKGVTLQDKTAVTINNEILGRVYGDDLANWTPLPDAPASIRTRGKMISFGHDLPDQPWVGVQSPVLSIDFSRQPVLEIEGVRPRGAWFMELILVEEDEEAQHFVVQGETTVGGHLVLDLQELSGDLRSDTVKCRIMFGVCGHKGQLSFFRDGVDIYYLQGD